MIKDIPKSWQENLDKWNGMPLDYDSIKLGGMAENLHKPVTFLLNHVEPSDDGCLMFTGRSRARGYGNINWQCDYTSKTRSVRAHRLSYFLAHGAFPMDDQGEPLLVRHSCHKPLCVNPKCLTKGTNQENCDDMKRAGRSLDQRGSKNHNSKLTESQRNEVLEMRKSGKTLKFIAEKFGVHLSTVGYIIKRNKDD